MADSNASKQVKIVATVLIFVAIALYLWHAIAPLPTGLTTLFSITQVVLDIHIVEGVIAAILIFIYRQRTQGASSASQTSSLLLEKLPDNTPLAIVKAGLYVLFVGTVGLVEIIKETKEILLEQQSLEQPTEDA